MYQLEEVDGSRFTVLLAGSDMRVHALKAALVSAGIEVVGGDAADEQNLRSASVDLVILLKTDRRTDALVRAIHCSQGRRYVPVIVILDGNDAGERLSALQAGCDDVVVAPFTVDEVVLRVRHAYGQRQRVDRLLAQAARLECQALIDPLTLIANRRHFEVRLQEEFARAQRHQEPLSLIAVDLDHFKQINDTYGHPIGDTVLRRVARILTSCVREIDIVARCGGEEFAALLPQTAGSGAQRVAERIREELQAAPATDACPAVTASLGISSFSGIELRSPDELLQAADAALYRAKRAGRNCVAGAPAMSGAPLRLSA